MIADAPATFTTEDGVVLEARVAGGPGRSAGVVICHPHPLYGGDMDSAVVVAAAEAARDAGLAVLRFNFRGVGRSGGRHGDGRTEPLDASAALGYLSSLLGGDAPVALAGYSFGAAVAMKAAVRCPVAGLALIAPPLALDATVPELTNHDVPIAVIVGDADAYCPLGALDGARRALPTASVRVVKGTDHFFGGALPALRTAVEDWARRLVGASASG